MTRDFIGYAWLQRFFQLSYPTLRHKSYVGSRSHVVHDAVSGCTTEHYIQSYYPGDQPLNHVEFALKYDGVNLGFLKEVFSRLAADEVRAYIQTKPTSKFARQIGFLYEFLLQQTLPSCPVAGNYVDLLDSEKYITARAQRNPRWRINVNLLGASAFCPIIRRTETIKQYLAVDFAGMLHEATQDVPADVFRRAVDYLYLKETKSSNEIERECPTRDREIRFVRALRDAGARPLSEGLTEDALVNLQNVIVDQRYAVNGFRDYQNYVGETIGHRERVHYICPPPQFIPDLMRGIADFAVISAGIHPIIRATGIAFAFVYAHPFEDGNGRIHRFLIHDVLIHDQFTPKGMILPVSACMLNNMQAYDEALERFSRVVGEVAHYDISDDSELTVTNPETLESLYRYPDYTPQAEYLFYAIENTIKTELVAEIQLLHAFDGARAAMRAIVDMPDRRMDLMLRLLQQNQGKLAKGKRGLFGELSDKEIQQLEAAFAEYFQAP